MNSREPTSIAWVRGDLTRDLADLEEQLAMAETAGPKIGDARSLWNFTPSPGWTKDECATLRLCLMKFGIGRWVQIVDSGVLPGKQIQQLNGQTQRLLGQQSLAEYTGMHVDVDRIREDNNEKTGPDIYRKNGLITNTGGKLKKEAMQALRAENKAKYGLSETEIAEIVLPDPPSKKKLGADAYMGKNHNKGGVAGLTRRMEKCRRTADVLTVDVDALARPAKMALLKALRARLVVLTTAAEEGRVLKENKAKAAAKPKPEAKKRAASSKRKSVDSASGEENDAPTPKRDTARRASAGCGGVVGQLVAMGFDKKKAAEAVKEVGNDTMECVNWLVVNCA